MDAGAARGDRAAELTGTSFGRYRIHRRIASGGMASVYLASFRATGGFSKLVALKRIHDHLAHDPDFAQMFLDEARIAARITHPNVCQVFDFGEVEGSYFLAMEYLTGETFQRIPAAVERRGTDFPWFSAVSALVAQAAEGLHAAHELTDERGEPLGIVHRDVSPANLFVTFAGNVKVMDFGIARAEGRSHHTRPGVIKGKLSYVAPEQAQGRPVDRRADIWALGVTLWELLTLRSLFRRGTDFDTLRAVVNDDIPRPSALVPSVPQGLDEVVMGALGRDPDQRFTTARELSRAIDGCLRALDARMDNVEIEEWMKMLFAPELRAKRALEREALEHSEVRSLPAPERERPVDPSAFDAQPAQPEDAHQRPGGSRRGGLLLGAAVAVAGLLGALAATGTMGRWDGAGEPEGRAAVPNTDFSSPSTSSSAGARRSSHRARRTSPTPVPALEAWTAMTSLEVDGSLPPSAVRGAIGRHAGDWARCYRDAARRAQRDAAGRTRVTLTIDEMGAARGVRARGEPLPGMARCVAASLGQVRSEQRPDAGRVRVGFDVLFRPRGRR